MKKPSPKPSPSASCAPKSREELLNMISMRDRCGDKKEKVIVCHVPKGNPKAKQTLCISLEGAVQGHGVPLDGSVGKVSGDYLGACDED